MKLLSVNVGLPREIEWKGKLVKTSIFKSPKLGPVAVSRLNLSGDGQSDLSVHGGLDKAVYAYPAEHYAFWREKLPDLDLTWGAFGENLTTEGLLENAIHIGDTLRIGSAMLSSPSRVCHVSNSGYGWVEGTSLADSCAAKELGFTLPLLKRARFEQEI